jgi:hypothetical protein
VEPYTPGFDVWSLVQLLEDMRRAAEAFGRSEIEGLFDASDAPSYEGELRDFLVESMWKNVGDVDGGADRLRARQIKEDIKGLRDATEDVKRCVVTPPARDRHPSQCWRCFRVTYRDSASATTR